jgi:hypothetical protein
MSISKTRAGFSLLALCGVATAAGAAHAQTSGSNGSHDPSRMIESSGRVYIYSTGGGAKSSADGLVWKDEVTPTWNKNLVANNQGIWAPDGLYLNGQYLLYGSMWSADKSSALVLLTSPTLDPSASNYKWTDRGVAIAGPVGVTHSVIDPAPILDAQGNLWVSWGGGYPFSETADSIFVTRLDNTTGLPVTTDPGWKPPNSPGYAIAQGHKEGSFLYYHGGSYFLWYQTGSCCSGTSSTYTMHVARASAITGPYSGDRTFFASNSSLDIHGPGHIGIYTCGTVERFTYHYYPNNGSVIGENALTWGSDGWPVAGAVVSSGLKLPCASAPPSTGVGGAGGGGGATSSAGAGSAGVAGTGGAASENGGTGSDVIAAGGASAGFGGANSESTSGNGGTSGGAAELGGAPSSTSGGSGVVTAGGSGLASAGSAPDGSPATGGNDDTSSGCSFGVHAQRSANGLSALLLLAAAAVITRRKRQHS